MRPFKLFDLQVKTCDRYTLINSWGEVFSFDENPFHPFGFGEFCCNVNHWKSKSTKHFGKRISFDELPQQAKEFVMDRI